MVIDINGGTPRSPDAGHAGRAALAQRDGGRRRAVIVTGGSAEHDQLVGANDRATSGIRHRGMDRGGAAPPTSDKARLYHSIGLLLPDASILVGGGGAGGPRRARPSTPTPRSIIRPTLHRVRRVGAAAEDRLRRRRAHGRHALAIKVDNELRSRV